MAYILVDLANIAAEAGVKGLQPLFQRFDMRLNLLRERSHRVGHGAILFAADDRHGHPA